MFYVRCKKLFVSKRRNILRKGRILFLYTTEYIINLFCIYSHLNLSHLKYKRHFRRRKKIPLLSPSQSIALSPTGERIAVPQSTSVSTCCRCTLSSSPGRINRCSRERVNASSDFREIVLTGNGKKNMKGHVRIILTPPTLHSHQIRCLDQRRTVHLLRIDKLQEIISMAN